MTDKRAQRKAAFEKTSKPSLFNPHYSIKGRIVQDKQVSCKTVGPQMKTLQWEPTGWKR